MLCKWLYGRCSNPDSLSCRHLQAGVWITVTQEIGRETAAVALTNRILSDYRKIYGIDANKPTFAQVYERFYAEKFPEGHKYSKATESSTKAAYRNCKKLHDSVFSNLKHNELQDIIDSCPLKYASLELMVSLFHQMYKYAIINDICEKDYSAGIKIKKADDDENGVPFTMDELSQIYAARNDETAEMLFIMHETIWQDDSEIHQYVPEKNVHSA